MAQSLGVNSGGACGDLNLSAAANWGDITAVQITPDLCAFVYRGLISTDSEWGYSSPFFVFEQVVQAKWAENVPYL